MILTMCCFNTSKSCTRNPSLDSRDDLLSCSCLKSKLSCIGCMRAHKKSTQA